MFCSTLHNTVEKDASIKLALTLILQPSSLHCSLRRSSLNARPCLTSSHHRTILSSDSPKVALVLQSSSLFHLCFKFFLSARSCPGFPHHGMILLSSCACVSWSRCVCFYMCKNASLCVNACVYGLQRHREGASLLSYTHTPKHTHTLKHPRTVLPAHTHTHTPTLAHTHTHSLAH